MWIGIRYGCVFHSGCDSFPPIKTESSGCQVLVVRRNMLSTRQTACWWSISRHAGQAQYGRAAYAIGRGGHWTARGKSRACSPECLEMHDEKRPKVEKAESGCGASAMQERSPDSRDRGAALLRLHLPRQERVRDTR